MDITQCGDIARGSYGAAGNGTAGIDVAISNGSNSIGQGLAGYRSVAHRSTLTVGYCFAGDGCLGSDISVFIYGESPVGPFDLAVSAHRCLGFAVGIAAGVDAVGIHHAAVGANLDSFFIQGNLILVPLVQDHFVGVALGSGHRTVIGYGGGILLQHIVVSQAQAAVHGFRQFFISPDAGFFFGGVGCVQSRKPIGHIGIDGIEPIYHILVDLLNHLVLGFICAKAGCRFLCQGSVQVGDVFANGVGCFDDGSVLYGRISLAYIIIRCLFFQILLHIGDPGIQRRIGRLTSSRFRIQVILQFIRGFVDCIGFVGNPFIQFVVSCFTACHFVVVGSSQRCNAIGCVLVHLLDDCILGLVSPDPGCCFLCQSGVQVGHILADGLICFDDGSVLYRCISLAHSLVFQIFLHIGDPGIQRCIAGFTSSRFRIQVILQLIRGIVDRIGFVGNPFIQFVVSCFTACHFVVVGSSQRCNAIGCVLVHLLDDCILGLVSPDPGCCFLCQSGVQVGHILADGLICFDDGSVLYRCISLAHSLVFQIFLHIGDAGIQFFIAGFDFIMDSVGFVRDAFVQFIIFSFTGCSFSCHFTISISFCSIDLCISSSCGIYFHSRSGTSTCQFHCRRIRSPSEVRAQKSCCHQHGCGQFLQSSPCGLALGVAFGDFRCHHIGVLCFAPDDFIDLIHVDTLL